MTTDDGTRAHAHDMSKHWRLVAVESGRVHGTFWVTSADRRGTVWVHAVDVTVYHDDARTSGRVLHHGDLTGSFKDSEPDLGVVHPSKSAEVEDARLDMLLAIDAAAQFAPKGDS